MSKENKFKVQEYNFTELSKNQSGFSQAGGVNKNDVGAKKFTFNTFDTQSKQDQINLQKTIQDERKHAKTNMFKVASVVYEQRGLKQQEEKETELKIQGEVDKRFKLILEEAYSKGFEQGQANGFKKIETDLENEVVERLKKIEDLVNEAMSFKEEIFKNQKMQMYEMLKMLVKWIALKEIRDDKAYISRLLEKIIYELQSKTNLLIKLNPERFSEFPEVLAIIEGKMGKLNNVRVEVDHELDRNGVVVESENGIIDASMQSQFETLDDLFKTLEIYDEQ